MRILEGHLATCSNICVLGAGNCNDLDLGHIVRAVDRVVLVDIDEESLRSGLESWQLSSSDRVEIVAPFDLSGLSVANYASDHVARRALAGSECPYPDWFDRQQFDVVISTGLVSQLVLAAEAQTAGVGRFEALADSMIGGHLAATIACVKPGGTAVVGAELVSSVTLPRLLEREGPIERVELCQLFAACCANGNTLAGMNPRYLLRAIESNSALRSRIDSIFIHEPWLWRMSTSRCYLAYALEVSLAGRYFLG